MKKSVSADKCGGEQDVKGVPVYTRSDEYQIQRFTFASVLPVLFVWTIMVTLYGVYVFYHLDSLLQWSTPLAQKDMEAHNHGVFQAVFFHVVTSLLVICFIRSVWTHPGGVPDVEDWFLETENDKSDNPTSLSHQFLEKKRGGQRRYCKWCGKYKPDRCHHCRVCKQCILKMDHHCPWIANCVGFKNHKYFFLLVTYSATDCLFITITMFSSVNRSITEETPFGNLFALVFAQTLAVLMGFLTTAFLGFHIWLTTQALTTIELCEKSTRGGQDKTSIYSQGFFGNVCSVLGPNPLFWMLPMSPPLGDGTEFSMGEHQPLVSAK